MLPRLRLKPRRSVHRVTRWRGRGAWTLSPIAGTSLAHSSRSPEWASSCLARFEWIDEARPTLPDTKSDDGIAVEQARRAVWIDLNRHVVDWELVSKPRQPMRTMTEPLPWQSSQRSS